MKIGSQNLAKTLEKMNCAFAELTTKNTLSSLLDIPRDEANNNALDKTNLSEAEQREWPIVHLVWNRWNTAKTRDPSARPAEHHGYQVRYIHGHDDFRPNLPHVVNLDSDLGKLTPQLEEDMKGQIRSAEHAQDFLAKRKYLVWSAARATHQKKHDITRVQQEYQEQFKPAPSLVRRMGLSTLVATVFFTVGMAIGLALVLTGAFAPLGMGLMGGFTVGGILGGGFSLFGMFLGLAVAINTEREPVETTIPEAPPAGGNSYASMTNRLGDNLDRAQNSVLSQNDIEETPPGPPVRQSQYQSLFTGSPVAPDDDTSLDNPELSSSSNNTHS